MKKIYLIALLFISSLLIVNAQESTLKFNQEGKFKIVQFTDIHWVPGNSNTAKIRKMMEKVLDLEKPDLVIITGDFINGKPVLSGVDSIMAPIVARKLPFTVTFGNHDEEFGTSKKDIYERIKRIPGNLLATDKTIPGVANHVLTVKGYKSTKDAALLYCLDSHAYSDIKGFDSYGWVKPAQVRWYASKSETYTKLNGGKPLPSLAFLHIPLPEYKMAATNEKSVLIGTRREPVCSPEINTGLFAAFVKAGDVMGVFAGHDHANDYATIWKKIVLAYGRFSGSDNTYCGLVGGSGARVIELMQGKRSFNTWIRLGNESKRNYATYPVDFIKKK